MVSHFTLFDPNNNRVSQRGYLMEKKPGKLGDSARTRLQQQCSSLTHQTLALKELCPTIYMLSFSSSSTFCSFAFRDRSLVQVYPARSQMQVCLTSKPSYLPEHVARGKDILFSGSLLIEKLGTRLGEDGELA